MYILQVSSNEFHHFMPQEYVVTHLLTPQIKETVSIGAYLRPISITARKSKYRNNLQLLEALKKDHRGIIFSFSQVEDFNNSRGTTPKAESLIKVLCEKLRVQLRHRKF